MFQNVVLFFILQFRVDKANYLSQRDKQNSFNTKISEELDSKEKKNTYNSKIKTETETEKDYDIYYFGDSGIGDSWVLGDENAPQNYAKALKGGPKKCPVNINIPRTLEDEKGAIKPVEVIGVKAFYSCADSGFNTKTVNVTKQVKIIKESAFGAMWNCEKFEIEAGSVLEVIEDKGLGVVGSTYGQNNQGKRATLVLPSTLHSVYKDGIFKCHIFKTIIYCGSNVLSNTSQISTISPRTALSVTTQYPEGENLMGELPKTVDTEEIREICNITKTKEEYTVPNRFPAQLLSLSFVLNM